MSTAVTLSIADLHTRNIAPKPHEAVAVVLALMEQSTGGAVNHDTTRFQLPSTTTIHLAADGSVSTENPTGPLAPAGVATLLQQVLDETPGVPPGLLYSIARALRVVEAPPFESTDAFLRALTRFERGDRREVIRGLAERAESVPLLLPAPASGARVERRRTPVIVNDLRKELRAVDRRRYEEQRVRVAVPLPGYVPDTPVRIVRVSLAFGFAMLLACATAADGTARPSIPVPVPLPVPVAAPSSSPSASLADTPVLNDPGSASMPRRATRVRAAAPPKKSSHLRVVFRFGWMKHFIEIHSS